MYHILRRGETLEQLSVRYGIPVCMIVRANPQIRIGAKLMIPPRNFCHAARRYTIRKGDTLFRIAETHNTTMFALLQKNPAIDPQNLREGDELLLPPPARIYTCRAVDTIRSVSEHFGISEEKLRKANNLSDGLYHGMQLILPEN